MGWRAPWCLLLVLRFCTAPCLHPTAGKWLAHCAVAEDCTTEPQFCECCELHRERTAYEEACAAICAGRSKRTVPDASPSTSSSEGFEFTEFGVLGMAQDSRDSGPHFDEPRLSLVGDASVVMGECYSYHVRTVELKDGGLQSCLMPPMPVPLFSDDPTPTVHNLSVCGATKAPFHLEESTGITHMLCFEECAKRNMSQQVVPPRRANRDNLYIASCTRKCFTQCAIPLAADCSASCGVDFYCLSDCHANATVCSIPVGPRDLRNFRSNPNEDVCHDFRDEYVSCVVGCSDDCHAALKFSKRTLRDDVADWYRQECASQTTLGTKEATECVTTCMDNCSRTCSEEGPLMERRMIEAAGPAGEDNNDEEKLAYRDWYGAPLRACSNNCSRVCSSTCFDKEAQDAYRRQCQPKVPRNCTALCFSEVCPVAASFCTIFDLQNRPQALELNCSLSNVSFRDAMMNRNLSTELEDINSPLSRLVKVNSSSDICYNDCFQNRSALSWEGYPYYTCKTTCYKKRCVKKCLSNCTAEAEAGGLPPCSIGREPGQCMGPDCPENLVSCSWDKAVNEELQQSFINITAILANSSEAARAEVWVPTWGPSECEAIIDDVVGSWLDCLGSCRSTCGQQCAGAVNYSRAIQASGVNDTSGLCVLDCQRNCSAGCLASFRATDFCAVPGFPENPCTPPKSCSDDCSKSCLDPTYLRANHGDMCNGDPDLVGPNETAVSLPYEYNSTYDARCNLNLTASECPLENTFYNVSRTAGSLLFRTECVASCYGNCSVRCGDQYCTTDLEEPTMNINVCLPKCIQRHALLHFAPSDPVLNNASESNVTYCLRSCTAGCVQAVTPACEVHCEPLLNPAVWDSCVSTCVMNTSSLCKRECVYTCTGNHTVAFGVPAPYDATGDYLVFSEVWEAQVSQLPDERPNERPWNNYSAECYTNCSIACTQPCFESAELMCRANATADLQYEQMSPRAMAFQTNNCTLREAASCFSDCRDFCHESCGNFSDPVVIARRERAADRFVYDTYVETCEEKCKLQIYGRNITTEEECLAFYPGYREECMYNCTQRAVAGCVIANSTINVYEACNSTCDELKVFVEQAVTANATAADGSEDGTADGAQTALEAAAATDDSSAEGAAATGTDVVAVDGMPTGADGAGGARKKRTGYWDTTEFDICIASCSQNYTDPKRWRPGEYYSCDGGESRRDGLVVLAELQLASTLDGGVSLVEQKAIDKQKALIPYGQLCDQVDNGCVFNSTLDCDVECAALVEYFQQLCVVKDQRNASFDYNISQCRHPDGWMVGEPKYLFYRRENESDPLGAVPEKIRRSPHWSYDDVEDHTILNCTCHFRNGTYDPRFVAFMLESQMRPYRNHFVSVCSCLFNETLGEPEHCIQSNHTFAEKAFEWLLDPPKKGDTVVLTAKEVLIEEVRDEFLDCAISISVISDEEDSTSKDYQRETFVPRVQYCYEKCGYHLMEQLVDPLSGNLSYAHYYNITGPVMLPGHQHAGPGPGLRGLVNSTKFADRNMFWYAEPECLLTCLSRITDGLKDNYIGPLNNMTEKSWKINSCTGPCQAACYMHRKGNGHLKGNSDNETAEAFACKDDATAEEGEPYCIATCQCHEDCSLSCVERTLKLATSAEHYEFFPDCMANCTRRCTIEHQEVCENVTLAVLAASIPPWVNETETCNAHIYTTCDFHCLPSKPTNLTANTTLFPAKKVPVELRSLDLRVRNGEDGYVCNIEKCPDLPAECPYPNITLVESGYIDIEVDPTSGNISRYPRMWNVSFPSYLECKHNRSSTCLDTCHDFGYRVCFPGEDPFDTCVQSCVANKTYEPPLPEFDHDVAACTKALRLTPSVEERKGAAWHKHKQRVQAGFNTTFTFKLGYPSERCMGAGTGVGDGPGAGAYPNHEERPGTLDMLCEFRGGDGFAFVIQDSGATMLEPECVFDCVDECTGNATQICTDECLSTCPARAGIAQATCTEDCAAGQHGESACSDFVSDCARRCVAAGGASVQEFALGTAMEPGGCMRECVWTGSYDEGGYCQMVCPLVDEDLDEECILACTERRLEEARGCLDTCVQVCASRTEAAFETCNVECQGPNALLPSGELVERCRQFAEVHLPHVGSVCMTSCRHDDDACLSKCARSPPDHISSCVDACPQNSTQCVVACLGRREQMAMVCMLPCVKRRCSHESVAIGEGANGVGFATLPNVLAVKFDTWFNAEAGDPLYNHIAVHASGPAFGTSTDVNDALGVASAVPDLGDGNYHTVRIEYEPELSGPLGEAYSDAPAVGRYIVPIGKPAAVTAKHRPPQEAEAELRGSIEEQENLQGEGREAREEKAKDAFQGTSPTSADVNTPPQQLESHGPRRPGDAHGLGELRVIIDGKQVLMLPINVGDLLTLDEGRAWVGFTGATGATFQEWRSVSFVLCTVHWALGTAPLLYWHASCHDAIRFSLYRRRHTIAHWLWGEQPCSVKLDRRGLDMYSCGE